MLNGQGFIGFQLNNVIKIQAKYWLLCCQAVNLPPAHKACKMKKPPTPCQPLSKPNFHYLWIPVLVSYHELDMARLSPNAKSHTHYKRKRHFHPTTTTPLKCRFYSSIKMDICVYMSVCVCLLIDLYNHENLLLLGSLNEYIMSWDAPPKKKIVHATLIESERCTKRIKIDWLGGSVCKTWRTTTNCAGF